MNKFLNIPPEKRLLYLLLTASLIVAAIGLYQYKVKSDFLNSCRLIKCKVTHIEEKENDASVYTFIDVNHNYSSFTHTVKYSDDDNSNEFELNKTYDFYYYPKNPALSEPKDIQSNYKSVYILFAIGIVLLINFSIKIISESIKKKKTAKASGKN